MFCLLLLSITQGVVAQFKFRPKILNPKVGNILNVDLLTKSSAVPKLSKVNDLTLETWTPISRWMPEHSMHVKTPRFVDNHVGSKGKTE